MKLMKIHIKNLSDYYQKQKFAVWFFLLSWLFLSVITSQKTHLYILQSEGFQYNYSFAYFRGFLTWTLFACFFPVILKLARKFSIDGKRFLRNLFFHLVFSIGLLFPIACIFTLILQNTFPTHNAFQAAYLDSLMWLSLVMPVAYWFVTGGVFLKKNVDLYHKRHQKAATLQSELKQVQLDVLQAQLHPHFLFNALHTVSALTFEDSTTAVKVVKKIRRYLDLSIKETDKPAITLQEELYFTSLYLDIEKERYSDRLRLEQEIDPLATDVLVPNMILQPLVENAIRHGISKMKGPGTVKIWAGMKTGRLWIEIEDSGPGLDGAWVKEKVGLGIKNTINRLQKMYDGNYYFNVGESSLGGCKIAIQIPVKEEKQADDLISRVETIESKTIIR